MSEHTPGPWRVTNLLPERTTEDQDYPGAEVSFCEADGEQHDAAIQVWSTRAEADARLIATAPDLLALLVEARKWMDGDLVGDAWDKKFVKRVDAAIAKAEGR